MTPTPWCSSSVMLSPGVWVGLWLASNQYNGMKDVQDDVQDGFVNIAASILLESLSLSPCCLWRPGLPMLGAHMARGSWQLLDPRKFPPMAGKKPKLPVSQNFHSANKTRAFSSWVLVDTSALIDIFIVAFWDPNQGSGQAISGLLSHRTWEILSVCCLESLSKFMVICYTES